eukprot:TRINITY_DN34802_c0_g2_i1.p1 TRINITY_DN34802_c0_g2~~TRINITY_DN34802_c0_g2_i1.p1  ORF type:complete len:979 (+),score=138.24 TRINITY_DN34802_c0_g2_i1:44-2938(+)
MKHTLFAFCVVVVWRVDAVNTRQTVARASWSSSIGGSVHELRGSATDHIERNGWSRPRSLLLKEHRLVEKFRTLRQELRDLQQRLPGERERVLRTNVYRAAVYAALCPTVPCSLGLVLEDIHVADADDFVRVALDRPSGEAGAPLWLIKTEIERQLDDATSALRKSGAVRMERNPGHVDIVFSERETSFSQASPSAADRGADPTLSVDPIEDTVRNTFGSPEANLTVAKLAGVRENSNSDNWALMTSLLLNGFVGLGSVTLFSILRRKLPIVFQARASEGDLGNGLFAWIRATWQLTDDDLVQRVGLDHAMYIQFLTLAATLSVVIGTMLFLIFAPLQLVFGKRTAIEDILSWPGISLAPDGSWLFWMHAVVVWVVVAVAHQLMLVAQSDYTRHRREWLKTISLPIASSVLVENIPKNRNTEIEIKKLFDVEVFGRPVVESVTIVKNTVHLLPLLAQEREAQDALRRIRHGSNSGFVSIVLHYIHSCSMDYGFLRFSEARLEKEIETLDRQIRQFREEIVTSDLFNASSAFVRFVSRREVSISMKLFPPSDTATLSVTKPPHPKDVIWKDLQKPRTLVLQRFVVGVAAMGLLFILFVPIVLGITSIAHFSTLQRHSVIFRKMAAYSPEVEAFWDGLVGSLILKWLMGCVPSIMVVILRKLFLSNSEEKRQLALQEYYFYFLVIYVLLVTSIGNSIFQTGAVILIKPLQVIEFLASTVPKCSHFYLSLILFYTCAEVMGLVRSSQLLKFLAFLQFSDEATAKRRSEPEDPDYEGLGSRSARVSLIMVTVVVFCSLMPIIAFFGAVFFFAGRFVYTYLFVFAETRKSSGGGLHFCTAIWHAQLGLVLYILVMTGLIMEKTHSMVPPLVASSSLIYCIICMRSFWAGMGADKGLDDVLDTDKIVQDTPLDTASQTVVAAEPRKDACEDVGEDGEPLSYIQPELSQSSAPKMQPSLTQEWPVASWFGL